MMNSKLREYKNMPKTLSMRLFAKAESNSQNML